MPCCEYGRWGSSQCVGFFFIFIPLHSRSVSAHDGDVWRRASNFFACLPRPFFKPKELANRAAASLWQRCRGQLARKEIMCCNAGSLAPCDTEIEVAAEVSGHQTHGKLWGPTRRMKDQPRVWLLSLFQCGSACGPAISLLPCIQQNKSKCF